jgi:aminoglycoside phosphotransferase (APT) family kinase protein
MGPRARPPVDLAPATVGALLAPLLGGAPPRRVARAEGGLVNTVHRVDAADGAAYALRLYAAGRAAFDAERATLAALAAAAPPLPVPDVLLADAAGAHVGHPYVVYRWIDGVTLNACHRTRPAAELRTLAGPLGGLLARIAGAPVPAHLAARGRAAGRGRGGIPARLARSRYDLRQGLARARLGAALADRLDVCFDAWEGSLGELEHDPGVVHGDLGGRNVVVRPVPDDVGRWEVSGVLDWETAAVGASMWDVGSLFRYPARYSPEFRERFATGYRAAGGALRDDWWRTARRLDATRLVGILGESRELPAVFAECRALLASVVDDCGAATTGAATTDATSPAAGAASGGPVDGGATV